jgi:hypothetical protein
MAAFTLAGTGCFDAPVESPTTNVTQQTDVRVAQSVKNKVDLLFMVDNSPSMSPKQTSLRQQFPDLIKVLDDFANKGSPADYHIGVVTSDLGAAMENLNRGQCHPGGDGAILQHLGAGALAVDPTCLGPTATQGSNGNYIEYNQLMKDTAGLPVSNLPGDHSLNDLGKTFGCMATTGAAGCGFEHQLESPYRAIHDPITQNSGFIRDDALLVIVWVTDEDDCSADPNSDLFSQAAAQTTMYGPDISYRCTRFGVEYDDPNSGMVQLMPQADSGGNVANPRSAEPMYGLKLLDITKYIQYYTRPKSKGGVKDDPTDVILFGIVAPPEEGVSSILANISATASTTPYQGCSPASATCSAVLQHSCTRPSDSTIVGDPAVRIAQVIRAAKNNQITSVCDDSYTNALQALGQLIVSNIGPGCITSPFPDPSMPDCSVTEVSADGLTTTVVPQCDANHSITPCWALEVHNGSDGKKPCTPTCVNVGDPAQQYGVTIDNGSKTGTGTAKVECSTLAIAPRDSGNPTNPLGCGP